MNEHFNFSNYPLEVFLNEKNCWAEGKLIGISNQNNFQIVDFHTNKKNSYCPEEIRIVVDTNLNENSIQNAPHYHRHLHGEYRLDKYLYVPCLIKNKKGNFYSIEIEAPNHNLNSNHNNLDSNSSFHLTKLARSQEIRGNKSIYFNDIEKFNYENFYIQIPQDMKNWQNSESFIELTKNIQSEFETNETNNKIFFTIINEDFENYSIRVFCNKEFSMEIRLMLEIAINSELKLIKFENDKISNLQKLKNYEKEINKVKKFNIDKSLVGLIIGTKGYNINRLKQSYNVNILINSDIPGEMANLTISGEDDDMVLKCYNEVNLVKKTLELDGKYENKLKLKSQEYISKFNLLRYNLSREKIKDVQYGTYFLNYLNVIGTEENVNHLIKEIQQYLINRQ